MIKRAFLYLRRKNARTALLFLLLFVLSLSLAVGMTVWGSITAVTQEVQQSLGISFIFRIPSYIKNDQAYYEKVTDTTGNTQYIYTGPELNENITTQIMQQVPEIAEYNAELDHYIHLEADNLIAGMSKQIGNELRARNSMIYGNTSTELYDKFRTGAFELVKGRHINGNDKSKVLISDELANLNDLDVGESIRITLRGVPDESQIWVGPLSLEVVGIFHVNGYQPTGDWVPEREITYNWLLSDIDTVKYLRETGNAVLYGGRNTEIQYENVTFFVDDPAQLDPAMDKLKTLDGLNVLDYEIAVDNTMYKSTVDPLNDIRYAVAGAVLAITAACVIVLLIVFTMWVRSRRKEIAIYLSLGIRKVEIIGQFVLEATIVELTALILTYATCQQVPDMLGNQLLASIVEEAQPEAREYTQEEIGQAAMTGTTGELFHYESSSYAGPEQIDFTFGFTELIILVGLELLIIIAAICKGGSFIFKLQPREIMTTLS